MLRGGEHYKYQYIEGDEKLKYIVFWEFCPEDMDKVIKKFVKQREDAEKNPGKYGENLYPSHSIGGQTKGFNVVEATSEQTVNSIFYWYPELKLKYMPIYDSAKMVEQYMKSQ